MLEAKEQIRTKLDIAEVIGEVVALKPAGRGQLKGLCPFHGEKTPSFHVQQERGFYYCFGCQAKGDVFDFVMRTQGIEFGEALQLLGQRAGIEVTPPTPKDRKRRDLFEVNSVALEFFRNNLKTFPHAQHYLLGRQLTEESITTFDLGFAPDSWDALLKYALTKGLSDNDLLLAGLVIENDNKRRYDRFRNRVMFPIKDFLGRVVGFSGRVLDDSLPKYLNTPETDVFKKGELLYGLDTAKTFIRSSGEALVVEGYMDVIALHQTGFNNAVAALGATLTAEQAAQLSRLDVQKLLLAFDADEAGQRAILSGLEQSIGRSFLVRAIRVPHGKDPADAVLGGHVEEFKAALRQGLSEVEFRFQSVLAKYDRTQLEGKKAILNELLPVLRQRDVFDPVSSEMRRLVIDNLKIDSNRLDEWVNSKRQRRLDDTQMKGMQRDDVKHSQIAVIELGVITLLFAEPENLRERLARVYAELPDYGTDSLLKEFWEICHECNFEHHEILARYGNRSEGRTIFEKLFIQSNESDRKIDIDENLQKDTSRLRDLYLTSLKEKQRIQFLEERAVLLERINHSSHQDQNVFTEELRQDLYPDLEKIRDSQRAREAERRMRVPVSFIKRKR